jgi:hypothetical protein
VPSGSLGVRQIAGLGADRWSAASSFRKRGPSVARPAGGGDDEDDEDGGSQEAACERAAGLSRWLSAGADYGPDRYSAGGTPGRLVERDG